MARADGLRHRGAGRRQRRRRRRDPRQPGHGRDRADRRHRGTHLSGCRRHHRQPRRRHRAGRRDRQRRRAGHHCHLGRPGGDGRGGPQRHQRPGRLRRAGCPLAVRAARRLGPGGRDAWLRRPPRRHGPQGGLRRGVGGLPRHRGRALGAHRLGPVDRCPAGAGHHHHDGRRRDLDLRHRLPGRRAVPERQRAVRAHSRGRQQRLHRAAHRARGRGAGGRRRHQPAADRRRGHGDRRRPAHRRRGSPARHAADAAGLRQHRRPRHPGGAVPPRPAAGLRVDGGDRAVDDIYRRGSAGMRGSQ